MVDKDITRKGNNLQTSHEYTDVTLLKNYQQTKFSGLLEDYTSWSSEMYPRNVSLLQHMKINHVIPYIKRIKEKNTIISIDARKVFDKIPHTFMDKK